jgi:hypothetical protein
VSISAQKARGVKQRLAESLASCAQLMGVGLTKVGEDYAVKVNLSEPTEHAIPKRVDGVCVVVEVVGAVRPRSRRKSA